MVIKKKLIEVALPIDALNKAASYEKMPGIGCHPRGLHQWWARRPLSTARAVIFAQMVDDPSTHPDLFPTEKAQEKERKRLFKIIEDLVLWENTTNDEVLQRARDEIWQSWRRTCAENADHPQAKELFDRHKLPAFHDPFAGGGALPLEAQRLGLESYASDLNPVAVLINKAMIEIPPKFTGKPPVNPDTRNEANLIEREWKGAQGLAEDVRYYGQWMQVEAEKRIGHLYPKVEVTPEMVKERPDLEKYQGKKLTVIAWIWARTVKSPNPAFTDVDVPLASTFMLSTKKDKEAYVEPIIEGKNYRFRVKLGKPSDVVAVKSGTKLSRGANFKCLMSNTPITPNYIKEESKAGHMGARMMAMVVEGKRGRIFVSPTKAAEKVALEAKPEWALETKMPTNPRWFSPPLYGMETYGDIFTRRQLVALTTFSDLVQETRDKIITDSKAGNWQDDSTSLSRGGSRATAYADAIGVYLTFAVDRCADYGNACTLWAASNQKVMHLFGKQAIAMTWDYPEAAILHKTVGGWTPAVEFISKCIGMLPQNGFGECHQGDATNQNISAGKIVSTDPPYYDNIGYADLSDFFYVWLRRSLKSVFQNLFTTVVTPKVEELVASPCLQGNKERAEIFFLEGMTKVMSSLATQTHPAYPVTIYYAFKQSEKKGSDTISTGWSTFLTALIAAGYAISGTWPIRSEQEYRMVGAGVNALASNIVLVCRPRSIDAPTTTRRDFDITLKNELPVALANMQHSNIAPVDLAQSAIGPGMEIYTRFSKVIDAEGESLSVPQALALINQTLDEILIEQEGDFDADTRWALAWFDQFGFIEGNFGVANVLATAKNTSVQGLVDAGIIESGRGKVRLWRPSELPTDWDPNIDKRLTNWEMVHHLIRLLEANGEGAAAKIIAKLGSKAEIARELCYRLYNLCERKKRAKESLSYNTLVQSWPEITRLAREGERLGDNQAELFV